MVIGGPAGCHGRGRLHPGWGPGGSLGGLRHHSLYPARWTHTKELSHDPSALSAPAAAGHRLPRRKPLISMRLSMPTIGQTILGLISAAGRMGVGRGRRHRYPPPIRLANRLLVLSFDRQTGAWIGLTDARSGEELVAGPVSQSDGPSSPPYEAGPASHPPGRGRGQGHRADGDWLYTPTPPFADRGRQLYAGAFRQAEDGSPRRFPAVGERATTGCTTASASSFTGGSSPAPRTGRMRKWPSSSVRSMISMRPTSMARRSAPPAWRRRTIGRRHAIYRFPARLLHRGQPNTLLVKVTNAAYDGGIDGPVVVGLAVGARCGGNRRTARWRISRRPARARRPC